MLCFTQRSIVLTLFVMMCIAAMVDEPGAQAASMVSDTDSQNKALPVVGPRGPRHLGRVARPGAKHNSVSRVLVGPPSLATTNATPVPGGPNPPCCKQ